jgi:hypothetical protein
VPAHTLQALEINEGQRRQGRLCMQSESRRASRECHRDEAHRSVRAVLRSPSRIDARVAASISDTRRVFSALPPGQNVPNSRFSLATRMLSKKVVRTIKVINTTMNSYRFLLGTSEAWRRKNGWSGP